MDIFLGIDVGSVSTKIAALDADGKVEARIYIPTAGDPLNSVKRALTGIKHGLDSRIRSNGSMGSNGSSGINGSEGRGVEGRDEGENRKEKKKDIEKGNNTRDKSDKTSKWISGDKRIEEAGGSRDITVSMGEGWYRIAGIGTTGSARGLAALIVGADIVKNEITAHATAAVEFEKDVRTILEIGGQDSKIILLRDGIVTDFAMNTVCAAGTGSFLEHQAQRLGVPIEEFGSYALRAKTRVRIAGRCTVFAESDMIHKQQLGFSKEDIIAGLCDALVRNYLNNVGRGKQIEEVILFQGGVAANIGIKDAFERHLGKKVKVPEHYNVMGAIGAAILARDATDFGKKRTAFKGFGQAEKAFRTTSFECNGCPNLCEIVQFIEEGRVIARWGDRCGKWQAMGGEDV